MDGKYIGASVLDYVDDDGNGRSQKMDTYFGSQWMSLQPDFVAWLAQSLKREDSLPSVYRDEFIDLDRLMSDETFVSTLLTHTHPFNETLPKLSSRGNARLISHLSKHVLSTIGHLFHYQVRTYGRTLSYSLWPLPKRSTIRRAGDIETSKADKPRVWGPYFLGVYDLASIIDNGALFIRKVSVIVNPNIVRLLPVQDWSELPYIGWPDKVFLTEKPNWEKKKAKLKEEYLEEKRKKKEKAEKEQADMKGEEVL